MKTKELVLKGIRNRRYAQIEVERCLSDLYQDYPNQGSISVWVTTVDSRHSSFRAVLRMQLFGKVYFGEANSENIPQAVQEAKKIILRQLTRTRERFVQSKRRMAKGGLNYALNSA